MLLRKLPALLLQLELCFKATKRVLLSASGCGSQEAPVPGIMTESVLGSSLGHVPVGGQETSVALQGLVVTLTLPQTPCLSFQALRKGPSLLSPQTYPKSGFSQQCVEWGKVYRSDIFSAQGEAAFTISHPRRSEDPAGRPPAAT